MFVRFLFIHLLVFFVLVLYFFLFEADSLMVQGDFELLIFLFLPFQMLREQE